MEDKQALLFYVKQQKKLIDTLWIVRREKTQWKSLVRNTVDREIEQKTSDFVVGTSLG